MWLEGLALVPLAGLIFVPLNIVLTTKGDRSIQPAEDFNWMWKNALTRGLMTVLTMGLLLGTIASRLYGLSNGLSIGLLFGLPAGLLNGLIAGFSPKQRMVRDDLSPNEGIRRSGRNGLLAGLSTGLLVGLLTGLLVGLPSGQFFGLRTGLFAGLLFGLLDGLFSGLLVGLLVGWNAFIQHFVLRFWLWRTNSLPWELIPFLDEATERLLLHKVGGSFMFIHPALRDYIADPETGLSFTETMEDE